jgi:hypothetical protein
MNRLDVSRRTFVVAAATAAAAAAPCPAPAAPAAALATADAFDTVPYHFDLAAFTAALEQPYPHRQLFAAVSFADAATMLGLMRNSLRAYADPLGFNAGPAGLHVAGVLYHGYSVLLSLDDPMYAKYPLGELLPEPKTLHGNPNAASVRALASGNAALFFVCNNALSGVAGTLAKKMAPAGAVVTRDQVVAIHGDLVAHFLPGAMLVPAGVAAINAAAEARFTQLTVV